MKILQYKELGKSMLCVLPPSEYIVCDPCYVLESTYDKLMEMKWCGVSHADGSYHLEFDNGHMFLFSTQIGDGRFQILIDSVIKHKRDLFGLGVDSGQLAIIDKRLIEIVRDDQDELTAEMTFIEPTSVYIDELSNVHSEHFTIMIQKPETHEPFYKDYGANYD